MKFTNDGATTPTIYDDSPEARALLRKHLQRHLVMKRWLDILLAIIGGTLILLFVIALIMVGMPDQMDP